MRGVLNNIGTAYKVMHYNTIRLLGIDVQITAVGSSGSAGVFYGRAGMRSTKAGDNEIINAFGLESVVFTLSKQDLLEQNPVLTISDVTPEKLDQISVIDNGVVERKSFTIDGVHDIHSPNGELIGWRCICKGA